MSAAAKFQERISYQGDLGKLISRVLADYGLGDYQSHKVITVGYEDFNVIAEVKNSQKYFIKFFADFRNLGNCQRYVEIIKAANLAKISHPKLFKSDQGGLHKLKIKGAPVRLCVLKYIEGKTFYDLKEKPNQKELKFIVRQAAKINQIKIKPDYVYDDWAVVNFLAEYKEVRPHLEKADSRLIDPLRSEFEALDLKNLPHCFVHGDIIDTNLMRAKNGQVYILDFSVSNFYPRIQELAIMLCDPFFDSKKPGQFENNYHLVLSEYQKLIKLKDEEIKILPLYLKVAHAMHIIGSIKSMVKKGVSKEGKHWLLNGRKGLRLALAIFS